MAKHRLMSDWFEPENEVRFITQSGELCDAGYGHDGAVPPGTVAVPKVPRERPVEFGVPWDEVDADDIINTVGGPERIQGLSA